ncbi:DnaJ domain-containing protein [Prochlorococcus marinus]|uniref:DnaJ domain-containing protein n=1 Tax=Prochlorococcus marinus TaxID=1219 RepID=UPI0022B2B219|nr:DnaJ domain-containing protein [Prochlorococcus marinus]
MTSTAKPDYWSILGLSPGSDLSQIKSAFRSEARRWHPDLNINDRNAEERFKLINEAYKVLIDPKKRTLWESQNNAPSELFAEGFPSYNEYLNQVLGIQIDSINNESSFNNEQDVEEYNLNNFDEFLEEEFYIDDIDQDFDKPTPSPTSPPPIKQLEDQESVVELTPDESLNGTEIQIELNNGTLVEIQTPSFAGDGWRLRLPGVAEGGKDHFIQLRVETDDGLRIDGLRVLYRLELFPQDALFGCGVEIPTLEGPVILQVPPKSSSGRLLRLRGRGLEYEELVGDQIVEVVIVLPADLTDSELALYKRLQELSYDDN